MSTLACGAVLKHVDEPDEVCTLERHGFNVMHSWEATNFNRFQPSIDRIADKVKEMVDHPEHYGGKDNPYEHVKVMEGVLEKSPLNAYLGGLIYNCTKYLWRLGQKASQHPEEYTIDGINELTLQDAKKAKWYLDRLVEYLEKQSHE